MRRALLILLCVAAIVMVPTSSAATRDRGDLEGWYHLYLHINAYGGWGSCTHEWNASSGGCKGQVEEGTFGHGFVRIKEYTKAEWGWSHGKFHLWWGASTTYLSGTKLHDWSSVTVEKLIWTTINGQRNDQVWRTLATEPAGSKGGPLLVHYSSHGTSNHIGYSIDLQGWVSPRTPSG